MSGSQILGGWDVDEGDASIYAMNEEGDITSLFQVHEEMDDRILPWEEVMACARVAAMGPELLEALIALLPEVAVQSRVGPMDTSSAEIAVHYRAARAAISKALGGAS